MNEKHVGSDFDDFLREEGLLEEAEVVAAERARVSPAREYQKKLKPVEELFDKLKREANELLEKHGVPIRPPAPQPIPRVRVRVLEEAFFRTTGGRREPALPGQELLIKESDFEAYNERGLVDRIGTAPPETPLQPRAFGEVAEPPYFEWLDEISKGQMPPEWEAQGLELPPESEREPVMAALWNAALVYNAAFELRMAEQLVFEARSGHATVPPEEALLWPLQTLAMLNLAFSPEDSLRRYKARIANRKAGSAPKYARGIQAAVNSVYQDGFSEQACWNALQDVGEDHFEVQGTCYEFYLDRLGDQILAVCQCDDRTGRERSIKRGAFYPYFARARAAATPTA